MKQVRIWLIANLVLALAVFNPGCKHDGDISKLPDVCFTNQILPILQANCTMSGCHTSGHSPGGINVSSYQGVMDLVDAGKPHNSELYQIITDTWVQIMPPSPHSPLTKEQRSLIYVWILQGAKNDCPTTGNDQTYVSDSVCYTRDVAPVLTSNCTLSNCHDATKHVEGYNFTTYTSSVARGIVKGNSSASKVYQVISASGEDIMPPLPHNPLTQSQINNIKKWIDQGAKNTFCSSGCDTTKYTWTNAISGIISNSCSGCHSGPNPQFNLTLQSYSDVKAIGQNGLLMDVLKQQNNKPLMPPSSPLIGCQITQISKWVANTYPN